VTVQGTAVRGEAGFSEKYERKSNGFRAGLCILGEMFKNAQFRTIDVATYVDINIYFKAF